MHGNVVVFSYNRPKMIKETIISVLWNSTHKDVTCWVVDDGSDFDARYLIDEFQDPRLVVAIGEKPTPEQRVYDSSRFVDNVNGVIEQLPRNEFVLYLCDDDILGSRMLELSSKTFDLNKNIHMTSADAWYFYDGQNPYTEGKSGFKAPKKLIETVLAVRTNIMFWHIGNFAHRTDCIFDEGLKWRSKEWGDKAAHSWDIDYIRDMTELHPTHLALKIPGVYRREHGNMLSYRLGRLSGDPMSDDAEYSVWPEDLSPEMIEGWME